MIREEHYAVINDDYKVLSIEREKDIFPPTIEEGWFDESDIKLNKTHQDKVREKYPFEISMFRNAIPLREYERKIIESALKDRKNIFLRFHNTAPVTLPIGDSYGRINSTTFYLKEPFNFDIRIE